MKKLILIAAIGLVTLSSALGQDNNTNSTPPSLTLVTNTIVRVAPLKLTAEQMDGIIQLVQGAGIQADGLITSTNLQNINVIHLPDNTFTIQISLRPIHN
jgi:hypothetical protein